QSSTFGVDGNYGTSKFLADKNLNAHAWGLATQASGESIGKDDLAFGASIAYPNDRWNWRAQFGEIQANFNPKLGFVPRGGIRNYTGQFNFEPRLHAAIKKLKFGIIPQVVTDGSNRVESALATVKVFAVENNIGDVLTVEVDPDYERLV